jgi:arsenate reductase-like glutaredoxin family protein
MRCSIRTARFGNPRQLEWKEFDAEEELNEEPLLLKTPIVREGKAAVIGYKPEEWEMLNK